MPSSAGIENLAVFWLKVVPHLLTVRSNGIAQPMQPLVLEVFQVGFTAVPEGSDRVRQNPNVSLGNVERDQFVAWASRDRVAALDAHISKGCCLQTVFAGWGQPFWQFVGG